MSAVKSMAKSMYRGFFFLLLLSLLLLGATLLLAVLADPPLMYESVQKAFGMN
ncbi:hypothetical protein [Mechercharimyces sp. CAU 1602]|uniref:hypothetical protein n=1 Tax=Mechercharimyces sp. CAU 1602 TaxID=2973933 RepID=UPI0021638F5C|nr:hypothetical protein [Mechercharimyces sp. CAU 1602]MCS1351452.1 hypothetical protein [Mechercharimyces sp. CAU 1602]